MSDNSMDARSAQTAETRGVIVCDLCGHHEDADEPTSEWTCEACREDGAAWWFPADKRDNARAHAATIAHRYQKGASA